MNAGILDLTHRFAGLHLLVIGEAMLDSYLDGYTDRLSREAPVPVVSVTERKDAGGGAANVAANVTTLGGKVTFLSVIGEDEDGKLLEEPTRYSVRALVKFVELLCRYAGVLDQ